MQGNTKHVSSFLCRTYGFAAMEEQEQIPEQHAYPGLTVAPDPSKFPVSAPPILPDTLTMNELGVIRSFLNNDTVIIEAQAQQIAIEEGSHLFLPTRQKLGPVTNFFLLLLIIMIDL